MAAVVSAVGSDDATIDHSSLEVKLKRDRVYRPGETVEGVLVIAARGGWAHKGVTMRVNGSAKLQLTQRGTVRPRELFHATLEVVPPGRVPDGMTSVPFTFALEGDELHESYHGVYINVTYSIAVECHRRGVMKPPLSREIEFIVEQGPTRDAPAPTDADPKGFLVTPESLDNVRAANVASIPRFRVSGKLDRQSCAINLPLTGEIVVEESEAAVRSIELQLVRSETIKHPDTGQTARQATEIQNIQIAQGDVCRNLAIPMYMVFPRLFTCPTTMAEDFKIEFEVNLILIFGDGYMITENFPIKLHRSLTR